MWSSCVVLPAYSPLLVVKAEGVCVWYLLGGSGGRRELLTPPHPPSSNTRVAAVRAALLRAPNFLGSLLSLDSNTNSNTHLYQVHQRAAPAALTHRDVPRYSEHRLPSPLLLLVIR